MAVCYRRLPLRTEDNIPSKKIRFILERFQADTPLYIFDFSNKKSTGIGYLCLWGKILPILSM